MTWKLVDIVNEGIRVIKVKVDLGQTLFRDQIKNCTENHCHQMLHVCAKTRPRYQMSIQRTIGPKTRDVSEES